MFAFVFVCAEIPNTHLTHVYVSEHVITTKMKDHIRDLIRENRKKHDRHCNKNNMAVISKCTNLWWNPINTIRRAAEKKVLAKLKGEVRTLTVTRESQRPCIDTSFRPH